jgi:hypothetical protein
MIITIYKIYDEDFEFYGDEEDIYEWLLDSQREYIKETLEDEGYIIDDDNLEQEIKNKGWKWGLEKSGTRFKEIYNKEIK